MSDLQPVAIQGGYIQLPVTTNAQALFQAAVAAIAVAFPGWVPQEGNIEVVLLEQFAQMVEEAAIIAAQVPLAIFQYFGSLVGINPLRGAPAQAPSTWTMVDDAGYTVPAGTIVGYQALGNVLIEFATIEDFTVPPSSTEATGVVIQALVIGAVNNGIADSTPVVLVNQLSFISSVAATATTSGGADPESLQTYLNRLSDELQLLTPRPILPRDFAALATNVAGVYRALAINLYAPGRTITGTVTLDTSDVLEDTAGSFSLVDVERTVTGIHIPSSTVIASFTDNEHVTMNNAATGSETDGTVVLGALSDVERCVTVAAVDIDGDALTGDIESALSAYLESLREVNFLVFVIGPTYTEIDVTWTGIAQIGQNPDVVQAAGDAAISAYLSQAVWGTESVEINGTVQDESPIITGVVIPTDSNGNALFVLQPNMQILGFGIPANAVIQSINTDGSITMSENATASGTALLTIILVGSWDPTATTVGYLDVAGVLAATPGLYRLASLTINIHGDSPGTENIDLPGEAPLTTVGTISGSVAAHS